MKNLLLIFCLLFLGCGPEVLKKIPERLNTKIELPKKFETEDEIIISKRVTYHISTNSAGKLSIIKKFEIDGYINNPENVKGYYSVNYEDGFETVKMNEVFYIRDGKRVDITNIQDIKLNSDVFYDNSRAKVFGFRNLTKGSVYHYSYKIEYKNLNVTDGIFLVEKYPIMKLQVTVINKSPYDVEFKKTGNFESIIGRSIEKIDRNTTDFFTYTNLDNYKIYEDYSMVRMEIPAYHFFINSEEVINDWNSLGSYFYDLNKDNFAISDEKFNEIVSQFNYSNEDEFIQNLFYYIQNNIRYVALVNGIKAFKADKPETVIKNKYGECKSMSFLLVSILKKRGIIAAPAIVNLGADNFNLKLPKLYMANHCIAYAKTVNGEYWLDATGYYLKANAIIPELSEKNTLVVFEGGKSELKKTPAVDFDDNSISYKLNFAIDGKNLTGKAIVEMSSFSAFQFRNILQISHQLDAMEKMKTILSSQFENSVISNLNIENMKDPTKELILKFDLKFLNAVNTFGSRQLINLNPISHLRSTKFSGGTHIGDYFYDDPSRINLEINLLKEGKLTIKSKSDDITYDEGFIHFSRNFTETEKQFTFQSTYKINKTYMTEDDYQLYAQHYLSIKDAFNPNLQLNKGE